MAKKILLCELNVSEGRDEAKIKRITDALTSTPNLTIMDIDSDADHNRSVFTWIGETEDVLSGAMNITKKAIDIVYYTL